MLPSTVVQSARDLGVILDSQLSLSDHTAALCWAGFFISSSAKTVPSVSSALVQLDVVWCAGVPAAESPIGARRRRSSHQHTAPWPLHSNAASTSLVAGPDKIACLPIARVPVCRHSTHLPAWSSSSPFIFSQDTGCSTDVHQLRVHKFRCCGTAPVEHFAVYVPTNDQLRTV